MEDFYNIYKSQNQKAKEALIRLEKYREEIYFKLKSNESDPYLHKELRSVNLDIKITLNEIEHTDEKINEFGSKINSILK